MSDEPFYAHVFVAEPIQDEIGFAFVKRVRDAVYRHVAPDRIEDPEMRQAAIDKIDDMERNLLRHVDRQPNLIRQARKYVYLK